MTSENSDPTQKTRPDKIPFLSLVLRSLCPQCHIGKINRGFFGIARVCPHCGYDLHPENGYYLGAMMMSFFILTFLTVPPVILLKVLEVNDSILVMYPILQYLILGPFLTYYAKIIWAHVGYRATLKMKSENSK